MDATRVEAVVMGDYHISLADAPADCSDRQPDDWRGHGRALDLDVGARSSGRRVRGQSLA
jgi:hypothetical protein